MQRKISYTQRKCPTPDQIRSVRERAGVNQTFAAAMVGITPRTWRRWEAGVHRMPPATWAFFNIKAASPASGSAS
ncbi:helix-turn-helix domain-containing protein [Acetobacter sp.]|uniref:helix-turn-helix domain-containing protein n=1 Tax=Acetobacter sp. TaxID=440 RepID=UPI0039E79F09